MGLKDLIRKAPSEAPESTETNAAAEAFIAAAPVSTAPIKRRRKSKPNYVRTTFSLTEELNRKIDKISLTPRNFRVSRSDVVRAGVIALLSLERAELLSLLEQVSKSDPIADEEE